MTTNDAVLLQEIATYYSDKLKKFGETPQGVDWNGEESQLLRFEQLSKIITHSNHFSLNDLGCGYGAFREFLLKKYSNFSYCGIDISSTMIESAISRFQKNSPSYFLNSDRPDKMRDYTIASGIFNVRLNRTDEEWLSYFKSTLDILHETSEYGFPFNCLTSYSDQSKMKDYLYYADACLIFDLCKRRYSSQITLLHHYELYEFTILVRKK